MNTAEPRRREKGEKGDAHNFPEKPDARLSACPVPENWRAPLPPTLAIRPVRNGRGIVALKAFRRRAVIWKSRYQRREPLIFRNHFIADLTPSTSLPFSRPFGPFARLGKM